MEKRRHPFRDPRLGEFSEWAGFLSIHYAPSIDDIEIANHTFSSLAGRKLFFHQERQRLKTLFKLDSELGRDAKKETIRITQLIVEPYVGQVCLRERDFRRVSSIKSEIIDALDLPQLMERRSMQESQPVGESADFSGKILAFPRSRLGH